jgi:glycosyltransferase involved in cell wall biosynthesis
VKLVIVHYHLRPGGIRRVIELATPHLVRNASRPITRVVLATGQCADRSWHDHFERQLSGVPVELRVEPAFNYLSEQRGAPGRITVRIRRALKKLFADSDVGNTLVWAHNLGVGRNLILSRELALACAEHVIPLVAHHHDWWFDNRWARWPEMRRFGFRTLAAPAKVVFPRQSNTLHVAINQADAAILSRHFGRRALWLPNLTEPAPSTPAVRVRAARLWLQNKLSHDGAPVWLLPCRTLRRKNIAEALLLTRWLRPEAWLVVTGAASSADEQPYFRALEHAAHHHHWRFRLGVLAGDESRKPGIPELLAASEAVLLTSIQEGFGLPYLEAAAAQRPLIARRLPNIAPDLARFGFRFPQTYDDILVAAELFDWSAERIRQQKRFSDWRATLPAFARARVLLPPMLAITHLCPVPFSRLTLTAQLEVLACPARASWTACAPLNPFFETWRHQASANKLQVTSWPRTAKVWLGGEAYARRFFTALGPLSLAPSDGERAGVRGQSAHSSVEVQSDFIGSKLGARDLYPLLWSKVA